MKRSIAWIMVACLLLTMMPMTALASSATTGAVRAYPFRFMGAADLENGVESTCYYSDDYFMQDASVYDSGLATMSLCFELTTWARPVDEDGWTTEVTEGADTAWKHAYDLLDQLGFRSFAVSQDWEAEPTTDSIGAVAASKSLGDHTLIALGIRGGGYGQEWASNFTVGQSGEHQGFATARDDVLAFLQEYITAQDITGQVKLWVVGYSRAGCVANMVAGALGQDPERISGVTVGQEDLFAYTFGAAQGATLDQVEAYPNIHNILNLNDIVPLVAPTSWGFGRYGVDRPLPSAQTSEDFDGQLEDMLVYFQTLAGDMEYQVSEYGTEYGLSVDLLALFRGDSVIKVVEKQVPTHELIEEACGVLFDDVVGGREAYVAEYQDTFRQVMALLFGTGLYTVDLQELLEGLTPERLIQVVSPMVTERRKTIAQRKELVRQELDELVEELVDERLEASGLPTSGSFAKELRSGLTSLLWGLLEAVLDDLARFDTSSLQALVNVIGMVAGGGLLQAHFPEVTLAWMMAQDENYRVPQVPEETEPEVTEPEVTEPEVTEPEVTEPEVTEPEVTEPEMTEPEVTEPEVTEPEVTEPEVTEPEVTEPEATEPEAGNSLGAFLKKLFGWFR